MTAAAAKYTLGDGGGLFGGGCKNVATQRDLEYERELTKANAEIGQLKAEKYADTGVLAAERRFEDKLDAIEKQIAEQQVFNATQMGTMGVIASQTQQLMKMTGLIINAPVIAASEAAAKSLPAPASTTSGS